MNLKPYSVLYTKRVHWGMPKPFTMTVQADSPESAGLKVLRKVKGASIKAVDLID